MSHQTGINANDELLAFFTKCKSGKIRVVSVTMVDEKLTLGEYKSSKGTWEDDYDKMVLPLVQEKQPCYILYRMDKKSNGGYEWLLISWSPDDSPIRQKMLYASTKATLKNNFGAAQISQEMFGTLKEEITLSGFRKHLKSESAPAPLTNREQEIKEIQKLDVGVDVGIDTRHQTIAGVTFPITASASECLKAFAKMEKQYVQLKINLKAEEIDLAKYEDRLSVSGLIDQIPEDAARYHLYRFEHSYEGDYFRSVVFIYSMPFDACPIRERMLYSSSRSPVLSIIEAVPIEVTKKIEISGSDEVTEEILLDHIHPKINLHRPKFEKPKGPQHRGAKRITKNVPK